MSKEILVSDEVYSNVQKVCQSLGMTPDEYFEFAAEQVLLKSLSDEEIIARINNVANEVDTSVDPVLYALQSKVIENSEW
jgi:hypothetical protein